MTLLSFVNIVFSLGVVASQIFVLAVILCLFLFGKKHNTFLAFIGNYGVWLAFLTVVIAVVGSLFYSQVAGFPPCDLCWLQRIFMYPEIILLGIALVRKNAGFENYSLWLAVIGGAVSLYQNYMYYYGSGVSTACQILGGGTSCVKRYVSELGYVSIPMMALTAFVLIIIFLWLYKNNKNNKKLTS